ncbi:MAG: hypothetical protein P1P86_16485 [Bacteroidales bacterium]|nr:hypothetical protein [Bacteroidales bacterium]
MKEFAMRKLLLLLLLSALWCNTLEAQNLHRVNNNTDFDADFTTLQAAVTAASNNDTIYVEGSATEYAGTTINKPLTLIGPGFFLGENPKTQANNVPATFNSNIIFASGSEGSSIMGCRLLGVDLEISVSDITVIRNYLHNAEFTGNSDNILLSQNYVYNLINAGLGVITNTIITNNIIRGQINSEASSGPLIVANNVCFTSNWTFPIDVHNASIQNNILTGGYATIRENTGNTISYNIMYTDGTDVSGNQYNIDMDLVFADFTGALDLSTDGKWELKAGSPAIAAGLSGADCGAFGGPTPYVLSGVPNLPHIYEAEVPASATSDSGLQVSIKVKSGE